MVRWVSPAGADLSIHDLFEILMLASSQVIIGRMDLLQGAQVNITGVVQGVGFRPFVYTLALRYNLNGWVRNTSAGVDIQVDGYSSVIEQFIEGLKLEAPPMAHIDQLEYKNCPPGGFSKFEIIPSKLWAGAFQPISPDVSICADCLAEILDPKARRFRYPFTNCTNCGPRFTIIEDIPYDRPLTTMASFAMCPDCISEYQNPLDRRFHAQPIACPECGPSIWLEISAIRAELAALVKRPYKIQSACLLKDESWRSKAWVAITSPAMPSILRQSPNYGNENCGWISPLR